MVKFWVSLLSMWKGVVLIHGNITWGLSRTLLKAFPLPPPTLLFPFPPILSSLYGTLSSECFRQSCRVVAALREEILSNKNKSHPSLYAGQQSLPSDTVQTIHYRKAWSDTIVPWHYCLWRSKTGSWWNRVWWIWTLRKKVKPKGQWQVATTCVVERQQFCMITGQNEDLQEAWQQKRWTTQKVRAVKDFASLEVL